MSPPNLDPQGDADSRALRLSAATNELVLPPFSKILVERILDESSKRDSEREQGSEVPKAANDRKAPTLVECELKPPDFECP